MISESIWTQLKNIIRGERSISEKLAMIWFSNMWRIEKSMINKIFLSDKIHIEKMED